MKNPKLVYCKFVRNYKNNKCRFDFTLNFSFPPRILYVNEYTVSPKNIPLIDPIPSLTPYEERQTTNPVSNEQRIGPGNTVLYQRHDYVQSKVPKLKQGRSHRESKEANFAGAFPTDASFAHAACHFFNSRALLC